MPDFFISYTAADRTWAEWIAWTLEEAGFKTVIQAWDFRPGNNFVLEMQRDTAAAERTIAVLSPDYLKSGFGVAEWAAAFATDPEGVNRKLIPVRVRDCSVEGLLKTVIHIDLVGQNEAHAQRELVDGVKSGRGKPASKPSFPGAAASTHAYPAPAFPGAGTAARPTHSATSSYKPKIGRAITDIDRRRFFKASFETVRQHFEFKLAEIESENAGVQTDFTSVDATKFTAEVFINGQSRGRCKVWQGGLAGSDGISYAEGSTSMNENAFNESLSLADDQGELALRAMMNTGIGNATKGIDTNHMSPEDAAEYLWRRFCWTFER